MTEPSSVETPEGSDGYVKAEGKIEERKREIQEDQERETRKVYRTIWIAMFVGILPLFAYGWEHGWTNGIGVIAVLSIIAAAAFAFSALIGFLFGIPRSLQNIPDTSASAAATQQAVSVTAQGVVGSEGGGKGGEHPTPPTVRKPPAVNYPVNTNLEQVSDWLTKIIVGVTLTQLNTLPEWLRKVAGNLANSLPQSVEALTNPTTIVLACMIYFASVGFLAGYLMTRLYLASALKRAELELRTQQQSML